jgi:hypothetical protein
MKLITNIFKLNINQSYNQYIYYYENYMYTYPMLPNLVTFLKFTRQNLINQYLYTLTRVVYLFL